MNLNEIAKDINKNAIRHGWWNEPRGTGEIIALCHSELSEALEEYRGSKPMIYFMKQDKISMPFGESDVDICTDITQWEGEKPEGIAVELADCIIRILDYCAHENKDLSEYSMDFNSVCNFDNFGDFISLCHACLSYAYSEGMSEGDYIIPTMMLDCVTYIYKWAAQNNVDMDEVIRIKHEYNKTRSWKHGNKRI